MCLVVFRFVSFFFFSPIYCRCLLEIIVLTILVCLLLVLLPSACVCVCAQQSYVCLSSQYVCRFPLRVPGGSIVAVALIPRIDLGLFATRTVPGSSLVLCTPSDYSSLVCL